MGIWQDTFPNLFYSVGIDEYRLARDNVIPLQSASIDYALGWFEGEMFNVRDNDLYSFHPVQNFRRLKWGVESASSSYKFPDYTIEQVIAVSMQLIALNNWINVDDYGKVNVNVTLNGEKKESIYMRKKIVSMTNGIGLGIKPEFELVTSMMPVGSYLGSKAEKEGATLLLANRRRAGPFLSYKAFSNYQLSMVTRADLRTLNERVAELAKEYPEKYGKMYCEDAIFMQPNGVIIEGTGENVGILKNNTFITPPWKSGCLPGITMRIVEILMKEMGVRTRRSTFGLEDILTSDLMVITGNYAGIVAVSHIVISRDLNPCNSQVIELNNAHVNHEIYKELVRRYNALKFDPLWSERLSEWLDKSAIRYLNELGKEFKKRYEENSEVIKAKSDERMRFETYGVLKQPIIAKVPKEFGCKIKKLNKHFGKKWLQKV